MSTAADEFGSAHADSLAGFGGEGDVTAEPLQAILVPGRKKADHIVGGSFDRQHSLTAPVSKVVARHGQLQRPASPFLERDDLIVERVDEQRKGDILPGEDQDFMRAEGTLGRSRSGDPDLRSAKLRIRPQR